MRSRIAVSAVLAAGVLLGSTGCAFISPVATQIQYDPSDGIGATIGSVQVRNALAITEDGETVNLVMYISNTSDETVEVVFEYDFEEGQTGGNGEGNITLNAGETVSFGNGEDAPQLILEDANTEPGANMPLFIQYGDETGEMLLVPVLDNLLAEYRDLLPPEEEIIVEPVPEDTAEPTATPTPTATPAP